MSTLYGTGSHRIVYKAEGFATGKTVTAYLWSPTLVKSALQTLTEVSDGLYYLDYTFAATGTYFGEFYEDGVAKTVGTWRVTSKTGYGLAADGLDAVAVTEPAGLATNFREVILQLYRRFFGKGAKSTTQIITYQEDGSTPATTQAITDDGAGNETQGEAS